jgi:hypothetical protein
VTRSALIGSQSCEHRRWRLLIAVERQGIGEIVDGRVGGDEIACGSHALGGPRIDEGCEYGDGSVLNPMRIGEGESLLVRSSPGTAHLAREDTNDGRGAIDDRRIESARVCVCVCYS